MRRWLLVVMLAALAVGLRAEDARNDDGFIGGITVKLAGYMAPTTPYDTQFSYATSQGASQTANTVGGLNTNSTSSGFSLDLLFPFTQTFTFGLGGDYFQIVNLLKGTSTQTLASAPSNPTDASTYASWSTTGFKIRVSAVWYLRPFFKP